MNAARRHGRVSCLRKRLYTQIDFVTLCRMRMRHSKPVMVTDDERRVLERWTRRPKTAQRLAFRARVVLHCAEGLPNRAVAARLHTSGNTVGK